MNLIEDEQCKNNDKNISRFRQNDRTKVALPVHSKIKINDFGLLCHKPDIKGLGLFNLLIAFVYKISHHTADISSQVRVSLCFMVGWHRIQLKLQEG
jgi:hypothetical protein